MTLQTDVRTARRMDGRYNNIPAFPLKSTGVITKFPLQSVSVQLSRLQILSEGSPD